MFLSRYTVEWFARYSVSQFAKVLYIHVPFFMLAPQHRHILYYNMVTHTHCTYKTFTRDFVNVVYLTTIPLSPSRPPGHRLLLVVVVSAVLLYSCGDKTKGGLNSQKWNDRVLFSVRFYSNKSSI